LLARMAVSEHTGIFNVASGEGVANAQIVEALRERMGYSVSVAPDAPAWDFTAIDTRKTDRTFSFTPRRFGDYFPGFLQQYRLQKGIQE
jgi:hypothetical protein